jgi:hypothetical protein
MRPRCTCTGDPQADPCRYCQRDIERAEDRELWAEDETPAAERFYEKDLDRIGGSL